MNGMVQKGVVTGQCSMIYVYTFLMFCGLCVGNLFFMVTMMIVFRDCFMKQWKKILYEKQPFPDNYSGGEQQFLSELRKNVSVVSYTYKDAVIGCSNLMCHINLVVLFFVLFENVYAETPVVSSISLLLMFLATSFFLYSLYYSFLTSELNILDHFYTVIVLTTMGFGMTPAIRTLTTTISTDTVYATSIISALVSCMFQDYGVKAPIVSQPIAISSGISSAIFLLSRLDDNVYAFTILSVSFVIHACSSEFSYFITFLGTATMEESSGPPSKRFRGGGGPPERAEQPERGGPSDTPSVVVVIGNLSPKATEPDLLEALGTFGPISYALITKFSGVGFVEFEEIESAKTCVQFAAANQIFVAGQPAVFNFHSSKQVKRIGFESADANRILVISLTNVMYPINADVINDICKQHGEVLRIAIVRRNGMFSALVEFGSIGEARTTKLAINGADIYSGCCTVKAEYAVVDAVRISHQDEDHKDYTAPAISTVPPQRKTLIPGGFQPGPESASQQQQYPPVAPQSQRLPPPSSSLSYSRDSYPDQYGYQREPPQAPVYAYDSFVSISSSGPAKSDEPDLLRGGKGSIVMVYGLDQQKVNCDIIFNLFCQYGNVLAVRFMVHKPDTAMVEMGTPEHAGNVMHFLNGLSFRGMTLELKLSFQDTLKHVKEPAVLPDGSPQFRDFTDSRNQRFTTLEFAAKNRMTFPSTVVHWYNSPPEMDEERIKELFQERGAHVPDSVVVFPTRSAKWACGTAVFPSVEAAAEALVLANHTPVMSDSGRSDFPYIIKMSFTTSKGSRRELGEDPSAGKEGSFRGRGGFRGRGRGRGRGDYMGGPPRSSY